MHEPLDRRSLLAGASASIAGAAFAQDEKSELPKLTHGPFLTELDDDASTASFWARASAPGEYELSFDGSFFDLPPVRASATARTEEDLTLRWRVSWPFDRKPHTQPAYTPWYTRLDVTTRGHVAFSQAPGIDDTFDAEAKRVVFGSCADDRKFREQLVWTRMREPKPNLVVLLGDTPYIDTTDLTVQRARYREFYEQPQFAQLAQRVPFVGTWDDHDYAGNDRFGAVEGRQNSRRAFLEYHGPGEWGENGQGIYTRRRIGPIEVFLLDTRWFADTEPSTFDAAKKTLLGAAQWKWLQKGLEASDAPFKVLACGMIWNDAVRPLKRDYWGAWPHEREGLFRWLGEKNISGVVLVSGDIHRTRAIRHATVDVVGYDIVELITSPLANSVIEAANAQHPGLLFDVGVEQSYLSLSANTEGTARLVAGFYDHTGKKLFELERLAATLSRH